MNMQTFTLREPEDDELQTEGELQLTTLSWAWCMIAHGLFM